MFTFIFSFLLLLFSTTTTTAQPYNATDHFLLACGSSSAANGWNGDEGSKFTPPNIATTSFSSKPASQNPSVPETPYTTARIFNTSSFTYTFPVSNGPKFLRLHFYPATYSDLNPTQSFFSVSSNGYTLLTNFSAFLTASYRPTPNSQPVYHFVKEFIIYVKNAQILNVTFTPSPNSYAFINGIEIVSLPENLYFDAKSLNYVGQTSGPEIADNMALETIYRLNMGGGYISGDADTGMYRPWEPDEEYVFSAATGLIPVNTTPITYTTETPNYTAPELVYATQRSMGNLSDLYNLTWIFPVDSGFYYMIRLHFCNIIPQYNTSGQMVFTIFIKNLTAEKEADPLHWTQGNGHPVFKDYVVLVSDPDNGKSKQDLWVAMHPNSGHSGASAEYSDAYLNGLEAFKLSKVGSLASPNPELSSTPPTPTAASPIRGKKNKTPPYAAIIGGVGGGLVLLSVLVFIVFRRRRRVKNYGAGDDKSSYGPASIESKSTHSCHSSLPSDRCRRFSLMEVKAATREFNDECIIGRGGFGKVYKGYVDNGITTAIKRLNSSSSQGFHEFHMEIMMLSKLRHVHLVSLIGYCDDDDEMVLVYDYMAHGTLREHLYKSNKPPLSWKRRLHISIGAARGLHYLHTSAKRRIIHRDVKSTNILLDENWVAKVSDFGLSKLGPNDPSETHVSTAVKGSMGYVDPEYYRRGQLTDKSDVYSFGVVLLEVLCARPAMIPGLAKEQVSLAEWGKHCYRKGVLNQIIDPKLRDEIAPECLTKFGEVANGCLKEKGCHRLTMEEVVYKLELALEVQESVEKTGGVVSENQELPYLKNGEATTTDDNVFSGSSGIRNGTSSISSTYEGFKSETVFSEMGNPTGR